MFLTRVIDPKLKEKKTLKDVRGNIAAVKELLDGTWTTTRYAYDPLSQIVSVLDDHRNRTQVAYDQLGRRTVIDNPDTGKVEYAFDPAGNLVQKVTPNLRDQQQAIRYDYDYHRLATIDYPSSADVSYSYGEPGADHNRAGRIVTLDNGDLQEERFYGKLGETVKTVKSIRSDVPSREWPLYTTGYLFDSMGRMRKLTYPDGEQLSYTYDQGGLLEGAAGVKQGKEYIYLLDLAYDEFRQRVKMELGNNVVSRYSYDPLNRRLKSLVTHGSEGQVLQNLSYDYDPVGNITQTVNRDFVTRDATARTVAQSYDYDDLHRLTAANGGYAIGGDHLDKYTNNFIYDTIGNFQTKDQRHWYEDPLNGSQSERPHSSYNFAYQYQGPQPHAPTHVGGMSYKYDANGNLIQRTEDQNGKERIIHWTEENRIARILDQGKETIFRYDDAGTRIVKRGKYGETVYVDPNFSIRNGEVASKHVFAGSTRIATKLVMQENRTGASKKTYVRPPGSTGHSGRAPEKSRGNHAGLDKQDASQPEKTNNGKAQEKQTEQSNNGKAQDKQSEKTNNGKAKGQNKNDEDDPELLADLPGNSEQGLANALSHGQGHKYGIYKKLERAGYTVDDDGDIVIGDGGSPSTPPVLNGNSSRPEEHQIYYYHGDHLGSSNVLTDRFGRNYEHLEYFPYGEAWVEETRSQTNLPYKFTGKELDPETGLYYFGARYYDPQVSIWVSGDPILGKYLPSGNREADKNLPGMGGVYNSLNLGLYTFTHQNPIIYKDPDGLSTWPAPKMTKIVGTVNSPNGGYFGYSRSNGTQWHGGVDMGGAVGDPVVAFKSGRVIRASWENPANQNQGFGQRIVIEHEEDGVRTYSVYAHLDSMSVNVGDQISEGKKIGTVGRSGNASNVLRVPHTHLHFEIREGNYPGTSQTNRDVAPQFSFFDRVKSFFKGLIGNGPMFIPDTHINQVNNDTE
jgi:RHS repeat-associated protein